MQRALLFTNITVVDTLTFLPKKESSNNVRVTGIEPHPKTVQAKSRLQPQSTLTRIGVVTTRAEDKEVFSQSVYPSFPLLHTA